ncbi:MAG: hypothetical protein FWG67_04325, partial [Defluviitaleaceae bacterium]|nr:hypothetical protein [Defluviitaleaceae bacterium]
TVEEREMLGRQQANWGTVRLLGGGIVLIASGGKSLIWKIPMWLFGGYQVVSGASDVIEGGHNMWLGSQADATSYAANPVLDTVFNGNRALYQNVNMFVGMTNWFILNTVHMIPDRPQSAVVQPDHIRILSNGQTLRSPSNFTGFRGNIQHANVPKMIKVNGQWVKVNNSISLDSTRIYNANGNPDIRATRRPAFDDMMNNGIEVNGQRFTLNRHAYNSLFKSGRKDVMPADITDALRTIPLPAEPGSVQFVNPVTGTIVFVNPITNEIVGIWPVHFLR